MSDANLAQYFCIGAAERDVQSVVLAFEDLHWADPTTLTGLNVGL